MSSIVVAICSGPAAALPGGKRSGIVKRPLDGLVSIGLRGIAADEQVDRVHHGWPAMALHHYPHEHHAWLRETFGDPPALCGRGSMGENLSTDGIDETGVLIGDRFRFGTALLEVTQPRQPCATIERHLQRKGVVAAMVAAGRCGWFYRILEPGAAQAGDALEQVEAGHGGWDVRRAFRVVYGGKGASGAELSELAALPRVSERMRHDIARRHGVG